MICSHSLNVKWNRYREWLQKTNEQSYDKAEKPKWNFCNHYLEISHVRIKKGYLKNLTSISVRKKGIQANWVSQKSAHLHWLVQCIRCGKTKPAETLAQPQGTDQPMKSTEKDPSLFLQKRKPSSQNVMCDLLCLLIWKMFLFCGSFSISSNHRHRAKFQNSRVRLFGFTIFLNHYSFWKRVFSKQHKTHFSFKAEEQQWFKFLFKFLVLSFVHLRKTKSPKTLWRLF